MSYPLLMLMPLCLFYKLMQVLLAWELCLNRMVKSFGAYVSRALNSAERHHSIIQKECLAAVFATKQFRHYLLNRPFKLLTEHCSLQWLLSQKMEGLLCRWALAQQEYNFTIKYCKGCLNNDADAISCSMLPSFSVATVQISYNLNAYCLCICAFVCKRVGVLSTAFNWHS